MVAIGVQRVHVEKALADQHHVPVRERRQDPLQHS